MAEIHKTTMSPTKLELVSDWLPRQPWYLGGGTKPVLEKAGGFRLDDPEGEVGIEFMVLTDVSGAEPVSYHLPLTYRGAPLEGAGEEALVGTSEHGVLGKRWVYDGVHDPVLVAQVLELLQGRAEPQAQSVSDTPDPTVGWHLDGDVGGRVPEVVRVLRDGEAGGDAEAGAAGRVTAEWDLPGGGRRGRGAFFVLREQE